MATGGAGRECSFITWVETGEGLEPYLVVELPDVLLYVWQQASEGELLDELSDVVVVIQGQTCPMAPCSPRQALRIPRPFLQLRVHITEGVQTPRAARCVQLERMAFRAVGGFVWLETGEKLSSIKT